MPTPPAVQFESFRPDLAGALLQYDLDASQRQFVGLALAPAIEVMKAGGDYGVIKLAELLKNRETLRTTDGGYNRGQGRGTKQTFMTEENGFEEPVDQREATLFGEYWDAEMLAASRSRDAVLRNHEQRVITLALEDRSQNTAAGAGAWSVSTSTPIDDVRSAMIAIRDRTGLMANTLTLEWEVFQYLKDNPQIIERIKYAGIDDPQRENINEAILAAAFDIEQVLVSRGVQNTADESAASTATLAPLWDKTKALLSVTSAARDMRQPRFLNTFHWGEDGSSIGGTMESYYEPRVRADVIRSRMDTDEQAVYPECSEIITGVSA